MQEIDYNLLWKKNKFKYYRKQINNYTQEKVAEYLGISQQQYQKYESGKLQPSVALVIKLADYYGVSVKELCGLED